MIGRNFRANGLASRFLSVGHKFDLRLINTVKESKERVVLAMGYRIIFMVVTLGTANG